MSLPEFKWLEGPYEAGSNKKAIEILLGDEKLINFINGSMAVSQVIEFLSVSEQKWIDQTKEYILDGDKLTRSGAF